MLCQTLAEVYEDRAEEYTRAAERTDDSMFRNMLLMLALQWRMAVQEEAREHSPQRGSHLGSIFARWLRNILELSGSLDKPLLAELPFLVGCYWVTQTIYFLTRHF